MKIKITEIEASTEDLNACRTLGDKFMFWLGSMFNSQPTEGDEDEDPETRKA
jgi:hypothetical protein